MSVKVKAEYLISEKKCTCLAAEENYGKIKNTEREAIIVVLLGKLI